MKRILSLALAALMMLTTMSAASLFTSGAVIAGPYEECLQFKDPYLSAGGVYSYFENFTVSETNAQIDFDLSMQADHEGAPILSINAGAVDISDTYIKLGSTTAEIDWGESSIKHWRHITITYRDGMGYVAINGETVVSAPGTCRTDSIIFIGYPGTILLDNLLIKSFGNEMLNLNFENEGEYINHKNGDSSAFRIAIPEGSYYDYEVIEVPDDVEYIFNTGSNCSKLTVSSGVEKLRGDLNDDGEVNGRDSRILKGLIVGDSLGSYSELIADVNADGEVSSRDSLLMKKIIVGTADPIPVMIGGAGSGSAEFSAEMQAAKLSTDKAVTEGIDASLQMDAISASDYKYAVITYMTPNSTENHNSASATQAAFGEGESLSSFDLNTDGTFHSEIIDLTKLSDWDGRTATLRFFIKAEAGDEIYIDSVIFTANLSRATTAKNSREAAKAGYSIIDVPESNGLGYYENGTYVVPFDTAERCAYVTATNNTSIKYDTKQKMLKATATGIGDPSVYVDLSEEGISADTYKYMVYSYMIPSSIAFEGPCGNFYYVCGSINQPTGGYESDIYDYSKSGTLKYVVVDLSAKSNWSGAVKGMRIDYLTSAGAVGDCAYIDSLIFCKSMKEATDAGNARTGYVPEPINEKDTVQVWTKFRTCSTVEGDEWLAGDQTNLQMYFRYTNARALTQTSLANRFAKAIKRVTGVDVSCEIYTGFSSIKEQFKQNGSANGRVQYVITAEEGAPFCVDVFTNIMQSSSASTDLNGDDTVEPDPFTAYDINQPSSTGVQISDSTYSFSPGNYLAAHSNHEMRTLQVGNKTFGVFPTGYGGEWFDNCDFSIMEISPNGSTSVFYTGQMVHGSTKPNIFLGYDGNVYIVSMACGDDSCRLECYYFNPNSSYYNVQKVATTKSYPPGRTNGGYGYGQPVLDNASKKIYCFVTGGIDNVGYYIWYIFNQQTKSWESVSKCISIGNRHNYTYGYPDGNGGVYLVSERCDTLAAFGLQGRVTGVDYVWDQLDFFYIPDVYSTEFTMDTFAPADYSQLDREYYVTIQNNSWGDVYLSSDGMLHILYSKISNGRVAHTAAHSREMWHVVYDTTKGGTPKIVYNKPIKFINEDDNYYAARFAESTSGKLYIIAVPYCGTARAEVWSAADANGFTFKLDSSRTFSNGRCTELSILVPGPRNNSDTSSNLFNILYPALNSDDTYHYYHFSVKLP